MSEREWERGSGLEQGWRRGTICLWKFIAAHKSAVRARVMDMLSENWAGLRGNDIDDSAQGGAGHGQRERERAGEAGRQRNIVNQL